ncbi:hypothetical protein TNCV_3352751 [Trichonephila clavipes]|nr:hypothetical protein TNCV_3352751 [Trichonephila clavipes]
MAEVGATLVIGILDLLNQIILVPGIACISHTYPTGETCDNQSELCLENKEGVAKTQTPTPGTFARYQLRHGVKLHHARVLDLIYLSVLIDCIKRLWVYREFGSSLSYR